MRAWARTDMRIYMKVNMRAHVMIFIAELPKTCFAIIFQVRFSYFSNCYFQSFSHFPFFRTCFHFNWVFDFSIFRTQRATTQTSVNTQTTTVMTTAGARLTVFRSASISCSICPPADARLTACRSANKRKT